MITDKNGLLVAKLDVCGMRDYHHRDLFGRICLINNWKNSAQYPLKVNISENSRQKYIEKNFNLFFQITNNLIKLKMNVKLNYIQYLIMKYRHILQLINWTNNFMIMKNWEKLYLWWMTAAFEIAISIFFLLIKITNLSGNNFLFKF